MSHARAPLEDRPPGKANIRARLHWGLSERILEATATGIVYLDLDGRIAYANEAAAAIIGSSVDDLLGQPVRTHLQLTNFDDALQLNQDLCWRDDGTSFPIECERAPLNEDDEVVGTVLSFRDVSKRHAIEEQKDERISTVSHELRTPLTSIRSALGLLAGGLMHEQPDKGQRLLEIAVSNTDRLIRLVNDMLDLERLESGQASMQYIACDVANLMHQTAEGLTPLASAARVTIDVRAGKTLVMGDPDRLQQVLINLVSNAVKFSPPGGATVWMEADEADGELVIRVRDEGRGIPSQMLESIFDRFRQVDLADAREKGGSGLGLAICRAIVNQHQGQIWAESTVGAGTTICLALPGMGAERDA